MALWSTGMSGRVSGCRGWYLSFTTNAVTHTRFHVKMRFRSLTVTPYLPCDNNFIVTFVDSRSLSSEPYIFCS
jgi:hypothetical protein